MLPAMSIADLKVGTTTAFHKVGTTAAFLNVGTTPAFHVTRVRSADL